jgi:hypothetical protein
MKHDACLFVCVQVVRPESELDFGRGPNGSTPAVCYKDVLRAMKKEVNLMDSLSHANVVEIIGTAQEGLVFVMERAVSDLYTIIKQHDTRLPLGSAKRELCLLSVHCMHVELHTPAKSPLSLSVRKAEGGLAFLTFSQL